MHGSEEKCLIVKSVFALIAQNFVRHVMSVIVI